MNEQNKKPILSICIPTYNRFENLNRILKSIFTSNSNEFDVIVLDNGSSYNLKSAINVTDYRLKVFYQDKTIPACNNGRDALSHADGRFILYLLDKDYIYGSRIDFFISELKKHSEIAYGYCELNSKEEINNLIIVNDIVRNIYRCAHPSGLILKNAGLDIELNKYQYFNEDSLYFNNPFILDLTCASLLPIGPQCIFKGKFIDTESEIESAKTVSYTYKNDLNNIYFLPINRIKQFAIFIKHLNTLNLSNLIYKKVVNKLIYKTYIDISIGYTKIMGNAYICKHYKLKTKYISFLKRIDYLMRFYSTKDEYVFLERNALVSTCLFCLYFIKALLKNFKYVILRT